MIVPVDQEIKKILLRNATTFKDRNTIITMEATEEERVDNVMVSKLYEYGRQLNISKEFS